MPVALCAVPKQIENALRKGVQSFAKTVGAGTAQKVKNSSVVGRKDKDGPDLFAFDYAGGRYELVVTAESKGQVEVKIVRKVAGTPDELVQRPVREADFSTPAARDKFKNLSAAADALCKAAKKPAAGQPKPTFNHLRAMKATLERERQEWINEQAAAKCDLLNAGCFAAGTKLWTPEGYRAIEDIKAGERVYSRDQWDEGGEIVAKIVEEVFERYSVVWDIVADGRTIRTTGEHPFFAKGKGWTTANELRVGDKLVCAESGKTVTVEAVTETGERELVYNLRVSEYHTYFVGGDEWGFSVWAHNTYSQLERDFHAAAGPIYDAYRASSVPSGPGRRRASPTTSWRMNFPADRRTHVLDGDSHGPGNIGGGHWRHGVNVVSVAMTSTR
jgi:hypothetical protein